MSALKFVIPACLVLSALPGLAGCGGDQARDSKVYQGQVVSLGEQGKTIVLANSQPKLNPVKGDTATFDLSQARVGLPPEVGNTMRIAYLKKGDRLMAIKVMNVSKQDLRKK